MPDVYLIGGPNGAGKTTCAMTLLPQLLKCEEYVNADAIAARLSPSRTEYRARHAGRLMLARIWALREARADFGFETTMASRTFAGFLREARSRGYGVTLLFLWLRSPDLAVQRVAVRVQSGGHGVPEADVRRRYETGLRNFLALYVPLADRWFLYDNSERRPRLVAHRSTQQPILVADEVIWAEVLRRTA